MIEIGISSRIIVSFIVSLQLVIDRRKYVSVPVSGMHFRGNIWLISDPVRNRRVTAVFSAHYKLDLSQSIIYLILCTNIYFDFYHVFSGTHEIPTWLPIFATVDQIFDKSLASKCLRSKWKTTKAHMHNWCANWINKQMPINSIHFN